MFPDSEIAKQYSCGRTKATQIVKGTIAPALDKEVTELCQKQPFGLMCDEGTNRSTEKEFAILVRVFEEDTLVTKFLHMPVCNIGTAEGLFTSLTKVLSERNIDWNNLGAFNSTCATRWLSLLTCINRVLNQWNALLAYFESHEDVEKPGKDFNVAFQAEGVMVDRLHKEMCSLVRRYLGRFLPAHLIADVPLKEIQFQDTSLQFPDEDLIIGDQAQTFLEDNKDELPVPRMLQ
ncbi:hypothetical protein KUCAC02_031072 [Chaenocephalus aceratus]|uniref:Uncharacterized protein n=1 Tax=Chaenocephalus aceratus TaxID=36190 RepID=A0ACB9XKM1_CHAAC|nr:hypothetical protein KUCAC02_031072 [Chaenocephalus aceratus]